MILDPKMSPVTVFLKLVVVFIIFYFINKVDEGINIGLGLYEKFAISMSCGMQTY